MGRERSESPRRRRREDDTSSRGESSSGHRYRDRDRHHDKRKHDHGDPGNNDKRRRYRVDDEEDSSYRSKKSARNGDEDRHRRDRKKREERNEESDEDLLDLEILGVTEISDEDYFLKSAEFKYWLREERGRYLDELSSESAHKYFHKFVRRWNDGALKERYYRPPPSSSSANTAYKWSFASKSSKDGDRSTHAPGYSAQQARDEDDDDIGPSLSPRPGSRRLGPALPSASDRQLAIESASEARKRERKAEQKERYEKADEMVPKSGGKEGKMDEKRATNAANREFRDKEVGGLEVDEGTLMGESSFQAALRARDAAKNRKEDKRAMELADRRAATDERLADRRAKESATMDMFKALAKQRFG